MIFSFYLWLLLFLVWPLLRIIGIGKYRLSHAGQKMFFQSQFVTVPTLKWHLCRISTPKQTKRWIFWPLWSWGMGKKHLTENIRRYFHYNSTLATSAVSVLLINDSSRSLSFMWRRTWLPRNGPMPKVFATLWLVKKFHSTKIDQDNMKLIYKPHESSEETTLLKLLPVRI